MCDVMKVERTAASIRGLAAAGTKGELFSITRYILILSLLQKQYSACAGCPLIQWFF